MISREVLKVRNYSFNLCANSISQIGKDVLTSYVGKMVESLFFGSGNTAISHGHIAHWMFLLLLSVILPSPRETEERN